MTRKQSGSRLPPVVLGSTLLPPPPELETARLPITTLDLAAETLYRSHSRHRTTAGYWKSNADTRFNAPNQEFGVLYLGFSVECAFIESTGSDLLLAEFRVVDRKQLDGRCICRFRTIHASQPVRVVDLTGSGLAHLNLDGRISTIKEREITRQWALAFWAHSQKPDGILYVSCNDPSQKALVLFDRAGEILETTCSEKNFLDDLVVRKRLLEQYNIEEVSEEPWEY